MEQRLRDNRVSFYSVQDVNTKSRHKPTKTDEKRDEMTMWTRYSLPRTCALFTDQSIAKVFYKNRDSLMLSQRFMSKKESIDDRVAEKSENSGLPLEAKPKSAHPSGINLTHARSVAGLDFLNRVLERFPGKDDDNRCLSLAYGSGVFSQNLDNGQSSPGNMTDFIFVVENPETWHQQNIETNPSDYSGKGCKMF